MLSNFYRYFMTLMQVIQDTDPLLRKVSERVEKFDDELVSLMQNMLKTMHFEKGMGIAAIQVGKPIRALIVEISKPNYLFIINPVVKFLSEETVVLNEGCLSVKGKGSLIRGEVKRPISISIEYQDLKGNFNELTVDGHKSEYDLWFARCIQHELDHLDGILFTDKLYMSDNIILQDKQLYLNK